MINKILSIFSLLALLIATVSMSSCKRSLKDEEFIGKEELVAAPGEFTGITDKLSFFLKRRSNGRLTEITDPNANVLAFAQDDLFATSTFSHRVSWSLVFSGLTSGAKYTISGTSEILDSTNCRWTGRNQGLRFFVGNGEKVAVKLSFLNSDIQYTDTLVFRSGGAGGLLSYPGLNLYTLPSGDTVKCHMIVDNFDGSGFPITTSYSDAADGAKKAVFFETIDNQVDGQFSYYMKGTDVNNNTYLGGSSNESLIELFPQANQIKDGPEQVYLNAYIYGTGSSNTAILFQVYEADNATSAPSGIDVATTDMWYQLVEVNWTGWKLVSLRYADFRPANNPLNGGSGNRIKEPNKIAGLAIELSSYPNPGFSPDLYLDLVSITTKGVFLP